MCAYSWDFSYVTLWPLCSLNRLKTCSIDLDPLEVIQNIYETFHKWVEILHWRGSSNWNECAKTLIEMFSMTTFDRSNMTTSERSNMTGSKNMLNWKWRPTLWNFYWLFEAEGIAMVCAFFELVVCLELTLMSVREYEMVFIDGHFLSISFFH